MREEEIFLKIKSNKTFAYTFQLKVHELRRQSNDSLMSPQSQSMQLLINCLFFIFVPIGDIKKNDDEKIKCCF